MQIKWWAGRRLQERKINSYQGMDHMGGQVRRPQLYYCPNAYQYKQVRELKQDFFFRDFMKRSSASCQVAQAFLSHMGDVASDHLSPRREINPNLQQVP